MKPRILAVLTSALFIVGCANERPIDPFTDDRAQWIEKRVLFGEPEAPKRWLGKVTVVATSAPEGPLFYSDQTDLKLGHFDADEDTLRFIDDVTVRKTPTTVFAWSATHHDLKLATKDGRPTNQEIEDRERPNRERRFLRVAFGKGEIPPLDLFEARNDRRDCWEPRGSSLGDLPIEVTDDYLSFGVTVDYQVKPDCQSRRQIKQGQTLFTASLRFSFRRDLPEAYVPLSFGDSHDLRRRKFGFFENHRDSIDSKRLGNLHHESRINRRHPAREHHYYFVPNFPVRFKSIFNDPDHGIFPVTNRLFAAHGIGARFFVHENQGPTARSLGDARYSFVAISEDPDETQTLGYGPRSVDPRTGEILTANIVLWSGALENLATALGKLPRELPQSREASFWSLASELLNLKPQNWALPLETKSEQLLGQILPSMTFAMPEALPQFTARPGDLVTPLTHPAMRERMSDWFSRERRNVALRKDASWDPMGDALAGLVSTIREGKDPAIQIAAILRHAAFHEMGHNLGLRHNFYGSLDRAHFRGTDGLASTSVMDYLPTKTLPLKPTGWQAYDEAALIYLMTDFARPPKENYLYCSDEHTYLNALCNAWDSGGSVSAVAASLVERYEDLYQLRNYRHGRAYWDTGDYEVETFLQLYQFKKFLALRDQGIAFTARRERNRLAPDVRDNLEVPLATLQNDLERALQISVAFYHSVLQQSLSERPWQDRFDPFTGELIQKGILADKIYAMYFLMGNEPLDANPSDPRPSLSFFSELVEDSDLSRTLEGALKAALTKRVDRLPWFLEFARELFAQSATDFDNRNSTSLVDKIRLVEFSRAELRDDLGIDWSALAEDPRRVVRQTAFLNLPDRAIQIRYPYYLPGEAVGIAYVEPYYYVASKNRNPYAFAVIEMLRDQGDRTTQLDLINLYSIYSSATGTRRSR